MNILKTLKTEKVLILGFGKEGRDTLSFLRSKFPQKRVGIADVKKKKIEDENVDFYFGEDYLEAIKNFEVIIKSPGIPLALIKDKLNNKTITSQTDIFLSQKASTTIGVTGTKGKSTTCLCIYNILKRELDEDVYLLGNIGEPVLNYMDKEGIFIYELSSFQLATTRKSPHIAIFLNLFRDHLDQHTNFKEYKNAKANIFRRQTESDVLIYNRDDPLVSGMVSEARSQKIAFNSSLKIGDSPVYLEPVLKTVKLFNISKRKAKNQIESIDFLPHRMERCGSYKGIRFINDSAATIPEAAVEAISTTNEIKTLITGGVDKGGDYSKLAKKIAESGIETLILFPDTGIKIEEELRKITTDLPKIINSESMKGAVKAAYERTDSGVCLLSPASSSFNMFSSYKDRGDKFKKYVKKYGQK